MARVICEVCWDVTPCRSVGGQRRFGISCHRNAGRSTRGYISEASNANTLLLLLLLLLFTAIELSLGGSSPYTSTDKTNKTDYT
jgi:hypothetical protein